MLQYILKRILMIIPVMLGVSIIVFAIMELTPGDPARMILGERAPLEQLEALRKDLRLDEDMHVRFGHWIGGVVQLDFGRSIRSKRPVLDEIGGRYPATLRLALLATGIAIVVGIPFGVISAIRPNSALDHILTFASFVGLAMPVFWQGLMMMLLFSVVLNWFPATGMGPSWKYYVLPAVTLGTAAIASIQRMTRSTMLETINQDFIRTARAKGVAERRVVYRHALRNAMIPVATVIGLQFGGLLAGAVITETIFSWPGIGRLAIDAIRTKDFPVVQGVILVFALTYAVVNLIVDVLYGFLDPRLRVRYS